MASAQIVLNDGTYRACLKEWGQTKNQEYNAGFVKKHANCFKMVFEFIPGGVGGYSEEHCALYEAGMTAPTIQVFGLIDPDTGVGIAKGGGKVGFDMPLPWDEFMEMFTATGASPHCMGKPEYGDVNPGVVDIEVKALPGSGNFAPKNVMKAWRNVERTANATALFSSALAKHNAEPKNDKPSGVSFGDAAAKASEKKKK